MCTLHGFLEDHFGHKKTIRNQIWL
uniref:Uncharacterized protein n=1 Tax=Arundo donax TaxID=35708 RepID=A0A0A9BYN0_ARUDO